MKLIKMLLSSARAFGIHNASQFATIKPIYFHPYCTGNNGKYHNGNKSPKNYFKKSK